MYEVNPCEWDNPPLPPGLLSGSLGGVISPFPRRAAGPPPPPTDAGGREELLTFNKLVHEIMYLVGPNVKLYYMVRGAVVAAATSQERGALPPPPPPSPPLPCAVRGHGVP